MIRVDIYVNQKIYTYEEHVDWPMWEITFALFDKDNGCESKCGSLGVCKDNQCVACAMPKGLFGWSKVVRAPPKLRQLGYYKVEGVEHYMNGYTEGNGHLKLVECRERCNKDCGCLGFFYREKSSKCSLARELGTFVKVSNTSHVGYIKISK